MRALAALLAIGACKDPPKPRPAPSAHDAATAPIPGWPELAGLALAQPVWVMDVGPRLPRPEFAAHPPLTVGERIVIAGSRLGYLGLDRASGEIAWRRPAGPRLSAPLALAANDVVLVRDCDEAVGAPAGHAVLACFDRIDPQAIAGYAAGRLAVAEDELADCASTPGGAWLVEGRDPGALVVGRGRCRFAAELASGTTARLPDVAVAAADEWLQDVSTGTSRLARGGVSVPGLLALATARVPGRADAGAVVVRADTSLTRDYVAAFDATGVRWVWPLPAPPPADGGRGGPVGISATERDVLVLFDGGRVARLSSSFSPPP